MKVYLQTRFNNPTVVYDTDKPSASGGLKFTDFVKSMFNPVIRVEEGNVTIYKTGEWYSPDLKPVLIGVGVLAVVGAGYIFYRAFLR